MFPNQRKVWDYKVSSVIFVFMGALKDSNVKICTWCTVLYHMSPTPLAFHDSKVRVTSGLLLSQILLSGYLNGKVLITFVFFAPLQVPSPNWAHYRYHITVYQQQMTWNIYQNVIIWGMYINVMLSVFSRKHPSSVLAEGFLVWTPQTLALRNSSLAWLLSLNHYDVCDPPQLNHKI